MKIDDHQIHGQPTLSASPQCSWLAPATGGTPTPVDAGVLKGGLSEAEAPGHGCRSIIDSIFEGVVISSSGGRIVMLNREAERLFGYEADELTGQSIDVLLPELFRDRHLSQRQAYLADTGRREMGQRLPLAGLKKDGTEFAVEVGLSQLGDGLVTATVRDVSAIRRAEAALREGQERYQMFMAAAPDAIVVYGPAGVCLEANSRFAELVGYPADEIPGLPMVGFIASDDRAARPIRWEELMSGETLATRRTFVRKDGSRVNVSISSKKLPNGDFQTIARDIGDRVKAEEALRESEERFRSLVQNSSDLITISDADGTLRYASPSVQRLMGYHPEDWAGRTILSFVHPGDLEVAAQGFHNALRGPGGYEPIEVRIRHANGSWRVVESTATNLLGDPAVRGIVHNSRDVTEEVALRAEQASAHAQSWRLLESIPSALVALDRDGLVEFCSAVAEATFGLNRAEITGRPFPVERVFADPAPVSAALKRCIETGEAQRLDDLRFTRADGREGLLGCVANRITDAAGGHTDSVLIAAADITDRKTLERQLAQAQKLESIGQLAAGVAHEINTPTQYIGDNIRFLEDAFGGISAVIQRYRGLADACREAGFRPELTVAIAAEADEQDFDYLCDEVPHAIGQSLEGVERVAKIVQAMKEFSHPGTEEKVAADINKAIQSTITVARNEWKYVADVQTELDPNLPLVPCYPGDLNQVVLNMIVNAAHAIESVAGRAPGSKGRITVGTRSAGRWAEIRVSDTGTGIPEAIRAKIFDPFFTTKQVGKGTGQGLAIAHAVIVEKHGGSIEVESEHGNGTTFILRLPFAGGEGA